MVHLHARSYYSLLRSPLSIASLVDTTKSMGLEHVALTDWKSMYGTMAFWSYAQKKQIHPILGLEGDCQYHEQTFSFVFLAKNDQALQQLYHVSTQWMHEKEYTLDELAQQTSACIVITTDSFERWVNHKETDVLIEHLTHCQSLWKDFYVGIAKNDSIYRKEINQKIRACAQKQGMPTVALSCIYYQKPEDVKQLRILRAIAKQTTIQDQTLDVQNDRYIRTDTEMKKLYDPADLEMTDHIACQCNVQMAMTKSHLPQFENKLHIDNTAYLIKLSKAGLEKRMNHNVPATYVKRLEYELSVIVKMGFTNYFLIVWDFIRYARSQGIYVGPGRGSAAGSLVAYCLGITHIDPIKNHLLFERFLNPERISMPDIDTDFPDDRRDEVIEYVRQKYGDAHVAHIVAFNTMKAKAALRDVARVLNYPIRKVDAIAKTLNRETLLEAYQNNASFHRLIDQDKESRELYDWAAKIEGTPRHISLHAAGIVISDQPIEKICPLVAVDETIQATQFPMEYLEDLGLIKMDFLSIRNLTTIASIVKAIETDQHRTIDILKLPLNDAKTYQLFSRGDTMGVFQLESDGIRKLLIQMQPKRFEDIAAVLALYRPGPMQNIPIYLENRKEPRKIQYLDPRLEPILKDTYGIIVYQEQIMQIAQTIGGFRLAQADNLRKAMGKKKMDLMVSYRQQFIDGAIQNQCTKKVAEEIFDLMERFAEYGFNKCHSYAYGMVAYQMAYLKANVPLYFYQSILNSVIGSESKTSMYIYECQRRHIPILYPDVNASQNGYTIEKNGLRMPLEVMKGIGQLVHQQLEPGKPYKNYIDFVVRSSAQKVNESNMRILIDGGALDGFGLNRATMQEALRDVLQYASIVQTKTNEGVLFNYDIVSPPRILPMKEDPLAKSKKEKQVYGFYLTEHPIARLRQQMQPCIPIQQALQTMGYITIVGQISRYHIHRTKKTQSMMCFLTLEDESAQMDIAIMPRMYEKEKENIQVGAFVKIHGKKDRSDSMIANALTWIKEK
ncbi:DNA polymerase III subunit alpha [Absicoccus intestinalis]|uniref:DNA polymerase III subunit alpha n=1 Tax=Absicoccus intestinalis TaxID=2926319 RepID=A0ABU4WLM0_9FIRM|nr:DNA polymerase III subunit alpha [Absicoccus sp. CLA-KB-P134]MDX8417466.1 DNA polymerase III subunit alpha [Absicoccus sp. CLA-KB-P134]